MAQEQSDLSFKLLSLLSKERGVYGLRNGDHERYRRHCTNKIQRLRQVTNLTSGKGKVYKQPPPITAETIKDVRPLQLLLFSAERALAHSHELKAVLQNDTDRTIRKEQLSWLRRSLKFSESLYSLSTTLAQQNRLNAQTLSEVTVYHLSIRSELSFERSQWAETITDLSVRRRLLSTLGEAARDSYDQALAAEFTDAYDPLIRFSAYKLGRNESHDIAGVVRDVDDEMQEEALPGVGKMVDDLRNEVGSAEMEAGRKTLEDVSFAGEKVEMRSAEIVQAMVKVQQVLKRQSQKGKGMRGWDRVLAVLGEAEDVARKLVDDHEASGSSSLRSADTLKSLHRAHQYILYLLLTHRIRRDLQLVETLQSSSVALPSDHTAFKVPGGKTKVEEAVKTLGGVVKLYDAILQSIGQIRAQSLVEERDEVRLGAEGAEGFFHASRNYHLARLHTIHPTRSYSSAIRLLSRSSKLCTQASDSLFSSGEILEPIVPISSEAVNSLQARITALDIAAKRALFAERVEKPVFFDTAFNYVELPMDELLAKAGKPVESGTTAAAGVLGKAEEAIKAVVPPSGQAMDRVKGLVRSTRESTPAVRREEESEEEGEESEEEGEESESDRRGQGQGQPGQGKKGWLGGWFGRN